jgi:hypothetical protein
VKKQVRIKRGEIACNALSPEMRALGRHVAHCRKKGDPYVFPPCAGASGVMCCARLN